ncbi:aminotransferase class V-fold PLP-dependent enzyme [bacterium]|nr:aminotransferase class V-fold PLP-dependent enzyme [bacterium]
MFQLRDDVTFLNHGSFGACPREVFAVYQELQRELEAEPVDFLSLERSLPGRLAAARARVAGFLGAERDEIVFVPNATTGMNIVARSLALGPGDEVLTTDHEYGAIDRTWTFLCEKSGARYVRRPLPGPLDDPDAVVAAVWAGVTPRTRVLALSHITSPTALVLPVAPLVARARAAGIITVIDGAHAPGQIDLDLGRLGADFYTGNLHKWLQAPKGAAFLHARAEVQHLVEPLVVSWGWRSARPGPSRFVDEQEWTGTRDPSAWLAVPAALDFWEREEWPAVAAECRDLLRTARRELLAWAGTPPLATAEPWLAQMATVRLPDGLDPVALGAFLRRERSVEIPVFAFADRGWLRISIQGYNTPDDVAALLAGLRAFPRS